MSIESLAGMFSQRSGVDQSMGNSIISAIIGFLAQKMMGQGMGQGIAVSCLGFLEVVAVAVIIAVHQVV